MLLACAQVVDDVIGGKFRLEIQVQLPDGKIQSGKYIGEILEEDQIPCFSDIEWGKGRTAIRSGDTGQPLDTEIEVERKEC